MQKSGSGLFYRMINDLLVRHGQVDAWRVREKHRLEKDMLWENNNIRKISPRKTLRLWRVSRKEGDFVVKTHRGPSPTARIALRLGMVRIIYSYRDPRDVVLSVMAHGRKNAETGESTAFTKLADFQSAVRKQQEWAQVWEGYAGLGGVLLLKYEDFMEDPTRELRRVVRYLGIDVSDEEFSQVLWKYSKQNPAREEQGLHYNNPEIAKYKTHMTAEQQDYCREKIGDIIAKMGYEL